jgi:uroporphyrinogen-III decarboxylase
MLLGFIEAGILPFVFWEGVWEQRLKYLTELPKGKTVGMFQSSDMHKVKDVLGNTMCIVGGMKISMLSGDASATEIREYTRDLCETVGKGGGFIMTTDILDLDGTDPNLVKVWIDATKEFGQY